MEESNKIEVSIELVGTDEVIEKLQKIKKLTNEVQEKKNDINDLRQKLIDYLYDLKSYDNNDIELIKILFNELK